MLEPDSTDALRSRLATESFLAQKQRELAEANSRIAERAKILTDEVIERRTEAAEARVDADRARARHLEAMTNLRKAKSDTIIAERRLWTSLETMADGFAVFDRDTRVVAANAAFFLPYDDMECIRIGISYPELVDIAIEEGLVDPGDMRPHEWAHWMKSRWDSKSIPPVTVRFWNNQFVRLTERRTPDGDVVMMGTNITRQIRRQKVLEEARRRAEAANRAKSAFLANMSHEIRTPMNGVLAMADLMAEGDLDEDQRLCLDTIRNSGQALLVIINDVLDYSKIEAQKLEIKYQPFDLEAAINEVTTLLIPTAREKGLSLIVDYDMFLPTVFDGDKGRLRQILMNLVGNALKFTEKGHVLVRVVGLPDPRPDHYRLHITVEDTGIGIPPEMREHIFGEFNQVQSEMTRQFDGTGLGLAITRRLVSLMGGDMWVDKGAESGSVFGFRLTLRKRGPDIEGLRGRFGQRRLLLFDPDPKSREVMMKQMMALGLRPEAIDAASENFSRSVGPEDLVIVCEDQGLQGAVRVGRGPDYEHQNLMIHRPILRDALLEVLKKVTATEPVRADHASDALLPRPTQAPSASTAADLGQSDEEPGIAEATAPSPPPAPAGEPPEIREEAAPVASVPHPEHLGGTLSSSASAVDAADAPPLEFQPEVPPAPETGAADRFPEPQTSGSDAPSAEAPLPGAASGANKADVSPIHAPIEQGQVPSDQRPFAAASAAPHDRSADQGLDAPAPPAGQTAGEPMRRVRVLAAEDNKTNRLVLTKLLKSLDIDLTIVENGRLALENFMNELPDIVLTDISMPEMDGMAAARAMRLYAKENDLPPIPIIAMTAHAVDGDERDILSSGIDFYLTKPLKKDVLIDHILAAAPYDAIPPLPTED